MEREKAYQPPPPPPGLEPETADPAKKWKKKFNKVIEEYAVQLLTGRSVPSLNPEEKVLVEQRAAVWEGKRPSGPPPALTKTQQEAESWDAWSWWDESGALTQALLDRGLRAGPDVTWSQGWDPGTSEPASRLLDGQARFKPKIIFKNLVQTLKKQKTRKQN